MEDPGAGVQCVKLCGGGLVQEVGCVVVVGDILVCLLVLTRYYWHCLWTSGGLPVVGGNFLENGPL